MKPALRRGAVSLALAALAAAPVQGLGAPTTAVVGTPGPQAAQRVAAELRGEGMTVTTIPHIDALEVSGGDISAVRASVGDDPRVDWIEPPRERTLFAAVGPLAPDAVDAFTDRQYAWAGVGVNARAGLASIAAFPVTVAVVDSGVDVTHPDLAGRIGPAWDVLTGTTAVRDAVGHGTFVAGLISAVDGNGLGVSGVAGATTLLPVRITSTGGIKAADAAAGITRAVDAGAKVINLSFGGSSISEVEKEALAYADQKDVVVVAAAGNSYAVNSPVPNPLQYPAAAIGGVRGGWSSGLSVAATDPFGRHAPFSSANDFVSVAAPGAGSGECGDGVFSTIPAAPTLLWDGNTAGDCTRVVSELTTTTGRYGYGEGTSFAAPLVSGAAALVRDVNPALTAEQTTDVIRRTAHQTIGTGWNQLTGAGVIDIGAAVAMARTYDTTAPVPALTVTPRAGQISVALGGADAAAPGTVAAGLASYGLERSGDGVIFTPIAAPQPAPIHIDDAVPTGERRWYRGTVCDAAHNCTQTKPVSATSGATIPPPGITRAVAPSILSAAAGRPSTCRACIRASFTAKGTGPLKWSVSLSPGNSGIRSARTGGTVPANGRVQGLLPLSRTPTCGTRITLTMSVTSPHGSKRVTRQVSVGDRCVRRIRR